jgi:hypothetical protein
MITRLLALLTLAVVTVAPMQAARAGPAKAKPPVCPQAMMREIDEMNRLYLEAGRRYAYVVASRCDGDGRISELVLTRQRDGKVITWKVEQGPAALARIILSGAEK